MFVLNTGSSCNSVVSEWYFNAATDHAGYRPLGGTQSCYLSFKGSLLENKLVNPPPEEGFLLYHLDQKIWMGWTLYERAAVEIAQQVA